MRADGFSLVETLVAMVLTLMVTGTAISLAAPASRLSATQPEIMDVQQRARVAAETIAHDLATAGAGMYAGPMKGVLPTVIPAVLPRRMGSDDGDGPDIARDTAITILSVPSTAAQTTISAEISAASLMLSVNAAPNCPGADLCGLVAGQDVIVTDSAGHFDVFRITSVGGGAGVLRQHGQDMAWTYPIGSAVSQVVSRTYEFDAAAGQLRQYDGDRSDQPVVDDVTRLSFRYFGAPSDGSAGLVAIPLSAFTDGPWSGAGTSRFDVDLLRVRMIRVAISTQAVDARFRALVPPFAVTLDVAPRSLSVGR
jgi:Tfp pilus assembly protein PilW